MTPKAKYKYAAFHLPLAGLVLFILVFFAATRFYPGGNQQDKAEMGFSWLHNYWCNLLNENAVNGQVNTARWWGLSAALVLSASLILFWHLFAQTFVQHKTTRRLLQGSVWICLCTALFTFTALHDAVINIAGAFGLIICIVTIGTLFQHKLRILALWGLLCLGLIALNNYLYYTGRLYPLPAVQKITFLCVLLWVSAMCFAIMRCKKMEAEN